MRTGPRRHALTAAATLGGTLLFAYAVRQTGTTQIIEGVQRVGWGLAVILALAGLRFVVRAEGWRLCVPPAARLTHRQALGAFLAGDAVGNMTPLGLLASEPAKVFLTRHHLATRESVASLALENLIYAVSVAAMVGLGLIVAMATIPMPSVWQWTIVAVLGCAVAGGVAAWRLLRGTWDEARGARPWWRQRLATVRQTLLGYWTGRPAKLWRVFALDLIFHALAVLEVYLTLGWLLADRRATLAQAVVFEAQNRIVTAAFKFVPFRIGIDEALAGALAPLLAVAAVAGVTLAVVRKVRNLFWSAVGLTVIAAHPRRND